MMKRVKLIAAGVIAVLLIIVIVQNREPVETRLLLATVQMPRAMLLAVTFLLGATVGFLAASYIAARRRKEKP